MELILWRHAEAEDGVPDLARQLTKNGLDQAEIMATWLKSQLPDNVLVLSSPARRAQQTAMALVDNFEIVNEIGPGASANQILVAANWPFAQGAVVVVSHQPTLGDTAQLLLQKLPPGLFFKKGSVWWFSYQNKKDANVTELRTVKYPEMLQKRR